MKEWEIQNGNWLTQNLNEELNERFDKMNEEVDEEEDVDAAFFKGAWEDEEIEDYDN